MVSQMPEHVGAGCGLTAEPRLASLVAMPLAPRREVCAETLAAPPLPALGVTIEGHEREVALAPSATPKIGLELLGRGWSSGR